MKILFVAHSSEFTGGANRSLMSIIEKMNEKKYIEVMVLVPCNTGSFVTELKKLKIKYNCCDYKMLVTKKNNGILSPIKTMNLYCKFIKDIFTSKKLSKELKNENIDLVYTNTRVAFVGAFVAKYLKVPHIWHIREFIEENEMKSVFFHKKLLNHLSNKVIVISKALKETFDGYVDLDKIDLIYNGLEFRDNKYNKNKKRDEFNILLTGSIIPVKGQMEAVKAIANLNQKGYKDITLSLAGSSPEDKEKDIYTNSIKEFVKYNKLEDRVRFLGEIKDIDKIRSEMDVELMCSKCEAFGRVTVEAMHHKLVVIGSNGGATPEIISHGENGLIYDIDDKLDLSNKIEEIYLDRDYANKLAKNGYEFSKVNFTIDKTINNIENTIMQVMNKEK